VSDAYDIQLWDLETGEEKARIVHADADTHLQSLNFSQKGRFLMGTNGGGTQLTWQFKHFIWDTQADLQAVNVFPNTPHISPCNRWILSWDGSGGDVWDAGQRRKQADLRHAGDDDWGSHGLYNGQRLYSSRYQFSPDGQLVLVTGLEARANIPLLQAVVAGQWKKINSSESYAVGRLWDVDRAEEIMTFRDCNRAIFSPDGRTLATLHGDQRLHLWTVPAPRPYGPILALTTATWGLILFACCRVRRRFQRWRRSTTIQPSQSSSPSPKSG
jgi:WD40 repeat protein